MSQNFADLKFLCLIGKVNPNCKAAAKRAASYAAVCMSAENISKHP